MIRINQIIKRIIDKHGSVDDKIKDLDDISGDIQIARDILSGKLKYCDECEDYYLVKSFYTETELKEQKICIYEDYINSGGNEYVDKIVNITYEVCPKGHKHIIHQEEVK